MSDFLDNKPPYVVLELQEELAKWLFEKIYSLRLDTQNEFDRICSLSSSDPQADLRSSLTFRLSVDLEIFDALEHNLTEQQPDLADITDRLNKFSEDRKQRGR